MASVWQKSRALLGAPLNEVAFAVRSRLRWSRGRPSPSPEPKSDLFPWLQGRTRRVAERRARELAERYDLSALAAEASRLVYCENLALLDRLDALAGDAPPLSCGKREVLAVDAGCGVFQYATALQRWLASAGRVVRLRGLEIDGFGIYRDGHSRADHARRHAELAGEGVSFEVSDFAKSDLPPQDVVSLFYPFLDAFSLLRWGSPLSHLGPRRLLRRAVASVRSGGLLLVANQTEAEFDRMSPLLDELPVTMLARCSFATDLVPYASRTMGRIGSLWRRTPLPEPTPRR